MRTILILLITFSFISFAVAQYKVTFKVKKQTASHDSDKVYVAGSFNEWNPSKTENGFTCDKDESGSISIQLPPGEYEYKFTRGNWDKSECREDGKDVANRAFSLLKDTVIYATIAGWKDDFFSAPIEKKHTRSGQVKIVDSAFSIPQLKRQRRIWIYLPQDYNIEQKRYAVIYMQDGQNLFDEATSGFGEWGIDEYLDSVYKKGIKESIIVGIDHGGEERMTEYNPYYFARFGKGEGDKYVNFIVKTLKPYIDKHFHTLTNKENTFIVGSSMGGLISLYALLKYPLVFGGAGIFSPAFWTANGIEKEVSTRGKKVKSKIFFYAGAKESTEMVPDMKKIELELARVSKSSLKEIIDPEAKHNEAAWRKYFPHFYQWIFGVKSP